LAEQQTLNLRVVGSIPTRLTTLNLTSRAVYEYRPIHQNKPEKARSTVDLPAAHFSGHG